MSLPSSSGSSGAVHAVHAGHAGRPRGRRLLGGSLGLVLGILGTATCFSACSDNKNAPPPPFVNLTEKQQLEQDTGTTWLVELDPRFGAVRFAMPRGHGRPMPAQNQTREQAVAAFLQRYPGVFKLGASGLTATGTKLDKKGGAHVTFAQTVAGVPVHGARITVHLDSSGAVTYVNGLWVPEAASVPTTAAVDGATATATALADIKKKHPRFSPASVYVQKSAVEIDAYAPSAPALVQQVYVSAPGISQHYEIDARSGAIVKGENTITRVDGSGKGIAYYATNANHDEADTKSISIELASPGGGGAADGGAEGGAPTGSLTYNMHSPKNGAADELTVYDYNQGNRVLVSSTDINAWDTTGNGPGAAVDAYVTMAKVDQFYADVLGRHSYDNAGAKVDVVVHQWDTDGNSPYFCNAFFDPQGLYMAFGDGDWRQGIGPVGGPPPSGGGGADGGADGGGVAADGGADGGGGAADGGPPAVAAGNCYPLAAALDVSAHEYTHAIVHAELNLDFSFEPGAMDESFADIFGGFAEHWDHPDDARNTEIGEQGWVAPGNAPLRSEADPATGLEKCSGNVDEPDNYSKLVKLTVDDDAGGRHCNSTIPSQAFYLMTLGGTNKTSQIPVANPLGWDDAQTLWYAILTQSKMPSSAKFADEAKASLAQAKQLNLSLEPVACAWVATGVLDNAFVRDNFGVLCACPGQDGGPPQDPSTFACCSASDGGDDGGSAEQCCKVCGEGGTDFDGSPPIIDGSSPDVQLVDSCAGRADGVYCSQLQSFSAIVCSGGSISGGQQCPSDQTCTGPNGGGTMIQCK